MAQEHIVVVRQEPGRGGRVAVRPWRVGEIEQLVSVDGSKRPEPPPQPIDDVAESREARPGPDVRDRGGAERRKVAKDQFIQ